MKWVVMIVSVLLGLIFLFSGGTMLGAIVTHIRADEMPRLLIPVVLLALATFTAMQHRPGR